MSVPYSGTLRRSGGVVSAIGKQLKQVNLKAAKRIVVKFDPFSNNVTHTRLVSSLNSFRPFDVPTISLALWLFRLNAVIWNVN